MAEPVLDGFEQVSGEVLLEALWVAVFCDVVEPLGDDLVIVFAGDGECSLVEPFCGPSECVKKHSFIFIVSFWIRIWVVEASFDQVKERLCGRCVIRFHGASSSRVRASAAA